VDLLGIRVGARRDTCQPATPTILGKRERGLSEIRGELGLAKVDHHR
jgi:hypothetical protein